MDGRIQKKRTFRIRTEFGSARQWRSRKNRPCDTCRRRKTACVIESTPPCRFCLTRGLPCRSTEDESHQPPSEQEGAEVGRTDPESPTSTSTPSTSEGTGGSSLCPEDSRSPLARSPGQARLLLEENPLPLRHCNAQSPLAWTSQGPLPVDMSPGGHGVGSEVSLLYTLEDNDNRTAHSMGLCAEQDTNLLASFGSVIMNEKDGVSANMIQVCPGNDDQNIPPIHFNVLHDEFQPTDDIAKARASESIEAMVSPHGLTLVRLFFKHVHPVYCVVSKTRFLRAYASNKLQIPASLRGAVYGLGSIFWKHEPAQDGSMQFDLHDLFQEAHSSLQREFHAPNLWKLQACLLLLYERPADNATIETPCTWVFSAHTVACSQMIGLHRDPGLWQIAPWEKSLRRRLWWSTYIADIWSSICHGNPALIYQDSFTTAPPGMDDLAFDEDVPEEMRHMVDESSIDVDISTSARFLQMVNLSRILHELVDSFYTDVGYKKAMSNASERENELLNIKKKLENWVSMIPQCVTMRQSQSSPAFRNNAPLHLSFFAIQALLYRALMSPAKTSAKLDPNSSLRRYFDQAVTEFQAFTLFMDEITKPCLHAFWGGHARSQLTLCGNFLIYLFLLASTPEQVHAAFELLGRFHESLQKLRQWADDDASLALVRPVALRIDSFFLHAARIMRTGMGPRSNVGPLQ